MREKENVSERGAHCCGRHGAVVILCGVPSLVIPASLIKMSIGPNSLTIAAMLVWAASKSVTVQLRVGTPVSQWKLAASASFPKRLATTV